MVPVPLLSNSTDEEPLRVGVPASTDITATVPEPKALHAIVLLTVSLPPSVKVREVAEELKVVTADPELVTMALAPNVRDLKAVPSSSSNVIPVVPFKVKAQEVAVEELNPEPICTVPESPLAVRPVPKVKDPVWSKEHPTATVRLYPEVLQLPEYPEVVVIEFTDKSADAVAAIDPVLNTRSSEVNRAPEPS